MTTLNADHIAAQEGSFEPQRTNNWTIEFLGLDGQDKDIIIMSLSGIDQIPGHENAKVKIPYQNEVRHVAGQAQEAAFTLSLVDYVDVETRNACIRWRRKVYDAKTGSIGLAKNYKRQAVIVLHAPDGSSSRVCRLTGCWPTKDVSGQLTMNDAGMVLLELPFSVDKVDWDLQ